MNSYLAMQAHEIWMIGGMALVTFVIRYVMFPISGRFEFPEIFKQGLRYVPPVVLTAIIVPSVFMPSGETLNLSLSNPYLIGALSACVIGSITKKLLVTIVMSSIIFLIAQLAFAML